MHCVYQKAYEKHPYDLHTITPSRIKQTLWFPIEGHHICPRSTLRKVQNNLCTKALLTSIDSGKIPTHSHNKIR